MNITDRMAESQIKIESLKSSLRRAIKRWDETREEDASPRGENGRLNARLKELALLLACAISTGAQVTDLGIVSPTVAVVMHKGTNRTDHLQFKVTARWGTNAFTFVKTNDLIELRDFFGVPDGLVRVEVCAIASDGACSQPARGRLILRRGEPDAPTFGSTRVAAPARLGWRTNAMGLPAHALTGLPGMRLIKQVDEGPPTPGQEPPMDNGTSESYQEGLKRMRDYFKLHNDKDRSGMKGPQ